MWFSLLSCTLIPYCSSLLFLVKYCYFFSSVLAATILIFSLLFFDPAPRNAARGCEHLRVTSDPHSLHAACCGLLRPGLRADGWRALATFARRRPSDAHTVAQRGQDFVSLRDDESSLAKGAAGSMS